VLEGPRCVVHFPPEAKRQAEHIVETFRWRREQAAAWLGRNAEGTADIFLVPDEAAMEARAPGAPAWALAVTRSDDRMVFRLDLVDRSPSNSLDLVLKHETVHFVLNRVHGRFPRWFEEGLCVFHAGIAYLELDTSLERVASAGRLPSFADADRLFRGDAKQAALGYRMGERVVAAFVARYGEEAVPRIVHALDEGAAFPDAFAAATGEGLDLFERQWRDEVTPALPFWLFVVVENFDVVLICLAAALVVLGYLRWRLRRAREMAALGGGD